MFLLEADERYILRIGLEDETLANVIFQNTVLDDLSRRRLGFALPRPIPSIHGSLVEVTEVKAGRRFVRLFDYVSGHPISSIAPSDTLLENAGLSLALLDQAMADISLPTPPRNLVWSIGSASGLRPLVGLLKAPRTRDLAEHAFENFERNALPLIGQFRHQIIHCDFNGNNVLVNAPDARQISGVIDFGDLTSGPLVHELAVAASRHCSPDNPLPGILRLCSGYTSVIPLQPAEAHALFDLICLRPAMRMAFWAGEAAKAGELLTPEIESPEASILANLLGTDARRHIEKCVAD